MKNSQVQNLMRQLLSVWSDFETRLNKVSVIDKINRNKIRLEDYKLLLLNHRHQVIDGASWIARAASNISPEYIDVRTSFIQHADTEQHDYKMLEQCYLSIGGSDNDFKNNEKNIGSEALSVWMFQRASLPDPFDLLGAMFIIEGLGNNKAGYWASKIMETLEFDEQQVSFYLYHGKNDQEHMQELEDMFSTSILDINGMSNAIVKTAKVTGRLYLLQLEELGNY
ncbi:MAG: 3-oxoacyl-ACP synthase [Proteobacteria bacterium]|nr:3-oxoacyl-ACP synthase [Pseudomonadota bacterium]